MANPIDTQAHRLALKALKVLQEHLMTWPELEAYAGGWVSLVGAIAPDHGLSVEGVYATDVKAVRGQFLRVDFGTYWVLSPARSDPKMSVLDYQVRMATWLHQIEMTEIQRTCLLEMLERTEQLGDAQSQRLAELLLTDPTTAHQIRCDLVTMLPDANAVAHAIDQVIQQFAMEMALQDWEPQSGTPLQ